MKNGQVAVNDFCKQRCVSLLFIDKLERRDFFPNNKKSTKRKISTKFWMGRERDAIFGAHSRSCLAVNARRAE